MWKLIWNEDNDLGCGFTRISNQSFDLSVFVLQCLVCYPLLKGLSSFLGIASAPVHNELDPHLFFCCHFSVEQCSDQASSADAEVLI